MRTLKFSKYFLRLIILVVFTFQGIAQEEVQQYNSNGLSTVIFTTSKGKITIYLPEFTSKENISGSLFIETYGSSDKKKVRHLEEIQQYRLMLGNNPISLQSGTFKLTTQGGDKNLQLLNGRGKIIAESRIQTIIENLEVKPITHLPLYMVSDEPIKISALCDGDLENNSVLINNQNVPILAESESGVFFKPPTTSNGNSRLKFINEDEVLETSVNVLGLDLSVGRTDLLRGETTNLYINVSGLKGLDTKVLITIANKSINNISLDGGNVQQLEINPFNDAPSGSYSKNISINALQRGSFSISVNIEPSMPDAISVTSEEFLCNCYISGRSYLISPVACEEIGGRCSENIEKESSDFYEDETPPNFEFELPEEIIAKDSMVNLKINDLNKSDCIAVVFSYRTIKNKQWQFIGADNTIEDGLSFNWSPPTGNDGVYIVRARVVNINNIVLVQQKYMVFNIGTEVLDGISYSIAQGDIDRALRKARATGKRIKEEEEKLKGMKERGWDAEDRKKENETAQNELVAIDKVLDSIPKTYKDDFKRILDSLASLRKKLPKVIDHSVLQKAIDDAQSRLDNCNERLEALKKEQANLEKERDNLKEQLDAVQEAIYKLHIDNGWVGDYGYHPDGRPWHGYVGGERANTDLGDEKYELKKQYRALKKNYLKTLKRLGELPSEMDEAEEDCEELNEALEKAKTAKRNADLHAATELEAEDVCIQIKRLMRPLRRWCNNNPDHCNFRDKIEELLKKCPMNNDELEEFWKKFKEIILSKKREEDNFGDAAEKDQKEINDIEDDISKLEDRIKDLKERQRKEFEEADKLRRQRVEEAAEEQKKAEARKREANKRKREDKKIKDLIKKAKAEDAGDAAFKNLMKGMGLDLLDEATGNLKLGKIIGGILVVKDMPDCVCPLLTALRDAFVAKRDRRPEGHAVYVEAYLLAWKKCANLPSISSVSIGGSELSEAIRDMNKTQLDRAIKALNQAIRVQCK